MTASHLNGPDGAWELLDGARTVLAVHAHPDDETLSTGALIAHLVGRGTRVVLVTATRGEAGETVPGSIPDRDPRSFARVREDELDAAAAALGVQRRMHLGTPPALAPGAGPRTYRDSGMQWVTPHLAGPADDTGPDALTRRPRAEALADLVAAIDAEHPDALISYDDGGTYGHPDHVRVHELTRDAARERSLPFVEVASYHEADPGAEDPSFSWRPLPGASDAVETALSAHRTQLTVLGRGLGDGIRLRMSGGQERMVPIGAGIRLSRP